MVELFCEGSVINMATPFSCYALYLTASESVQLFKYYI